MYTHLSGSVDAGHHSKIVIVVGIKTGIDGARFAEMTGTTEMTETTGMKEI